MRTCSVDDDGDPGPRTPSKLSDGRVGTVTLAPTFVSKAVNGQKLSEVGRPLQSMCVIAVMGVLTLDSMRVLFNVDATH